MKIGILTLFAVLPICGANAQSECCGGSRPETMVFRDAATHESVSKKDEPKVNPISSLRKVVSEGGAGGGSEPVKPASLIERSDIIHYGPLVTLLPKRAVLHLPDSMRGVRGKVMGKKLVNWKEFYRANRAWIDTVEVNRAQAEGREALSEELVKSFQKRSKAVVAVLKGCPISVLPHAAPDEETNMKTMP